MSKYTKALNKIQAEREGQRVPKREARSPYQVSEHLAVKGNGADYWDLGVPASKNVTPDHRVVLKRFPQSLVAEQYRMLRTSLLSQMEKESAKVILISSAIRGEGKTVTSANLAVAFAESENQKIVVLDADMRRGKLAEYLGFGNKGPGLSQYLRSDMSPKEILIRNVSDHLHVIPRGEAINNAAELVNSNKFQFLIEDLRRRFDYVFIDSPPIMSVADAGIIGRFCDGVVLAIQLGHTPKPVISHACHLFKQANVKLLGYILTNVEFQNSEYRYYQSYDYAYAYAGKSDAQNAREKSLFYLKKSAQKLKDVEEKFNHWWHRRVLKKKVVQ